MTAGAADLLIQGEGRDRPARTCSWAASPRARPRQLFWRRFRSDRFALVSLGFLVLLVIVAIAAPLVVKLAGVPGPYVQNPNATNAFGSPLGPSAAHPFGVDQLGRDVFARVVYGARVSLEVGVIGTAHRRCSSALSSVCSPASTGARSTRCSRALSTSCSPSPSCCSASGSAPPAACAAASKALIQPGVPTIVAIVALVNWTYIARIVRGQVLSLREKEFVQAARSLGASNTRILFTEILPNLLAPLIVYSSLLIPAEHPA